jgi:hypothetical protein
MIDGAFPGLHVQRYFQRQRSENCPDTLATTVVLHFAVLAEGKCLAQMIVSVPLNETCDVIDRVQHSRGSFHFRLWFRKTVHQKPEHGVCSFENN